MLPALSSGLLCFLSPNVQVRNLVEKPACRCPVTFLVEKQPKGRYRVGEKILYVRVSGAHWCVEHHG